MTASRSAGDGSPAGITSVPPVPGGPRAGVGPHSDSAPAPATTTTTPATSSGRLVLSVAETAEALGISDDLVYELMHRGQLPSLTFGRRKVVPRRAIDLVIQAAMNGFDPVDLLSRLSHQSRRRP